MIEFIKIYKQCVIEERYYSFVSCFGLFSVYFFNDYLGIFELLEIPIFFNNIVLYLSFISLMNGFYFIYLNLKTNLND